MSLVSWPTKFNAGQRKKEDMTNRKVLCVKVLSVEFGFITEGKMLLA